MPATLQQLLRVHSQAVECCIGYLKAIEDTLSVNRLLDPVNRRLGRVGKDSLRRALQCRRYDSVHSEVEQRKHERNRLEGRSYERTEQGLERENLEALARESDLTIVGDPGSGKSEWLKYATILAAERQRISLENGTVLENQIRLPVWLTLPELAKALNAKGDAKVEDDIIAFFTVTLALGELTPWSSLDNRRRVLVRVLWTLHQNPFRASPHSQDASCAISEAERNRRYVRALRKLWDDWNEPMDSPLESEARGMLDSVFCVDAWDEVRDGSRGIAKEALENLRAHLIPRGYKFRLTSRVVGFDPTLGHSGAFEILRLGNNEILAFLENFFPEEGDSTSAVLTKKLEDQPAVRDLVRNPLMLTLLALLFTESSHEHVDIPTRRVDIIGRIFADLVGPREVDRRKLPPKKEAEFRREREALRAIAWHFGPEEMLLPAERLERFCQKGLKRRFGLGFFVRRRPVYERLTEDTPVLVPCGSYYRFLHLTLQEYLIALDVAGVINYTGSIEEGESGWNRFFVISSCTGSTRRECASEFFKRVILTHEWEFVVLLVAGLLDDPLPLLEFLVLGAKEQRDRVDDLSLGRLWLAAFAFEEIEKEKLKADKRYSRIAGEVREWLVSTEELLRRTGAATVRWIGDARGIIDAATSLFEAADLDSLLSRLRDSESSECVAACAMLSRAPAEFWRKIAPGDLIGLLTRESSAVRDAAVNTLDGAPALFWDRVEPGQLLAMIQDVQHARSGLEAMKVAPGSFWDRIHPTTLLDPIRHQESWGVEAFGVAPEAFWERIEPRELLDLIERGKPVTVGLKTLGVAPESFWDRIEAEDVRKLIEDDDDFSEAVLDVLEEAPESVLDRMPEFRRTPSEPTILRSGTLGMI